MSRLAPNLFTRRFRDLVESGRARLPGLAPEWTDHNLHDPGITLMELLAWVAEAQMYSVSRMRRDERVAYARLLGISPSGTRPARGLLWPDRLDPESPAATFLQSRVIPGEALIQPRDSDIPAFHPTHPLLWVPGRITGLQTRLAAGRVIEHTALNARGGPAFEPFGAAAAHGDVLLLTFEARDEAGIFPRRRDEARGALWAIGIRAEDEAAPGEAGASSASPLEVTLVDARGRHPVRVAADTSLGFLRTGALLLDMGGLPHSPRALTLEIRHTRGFARPPRISRIEPGVVPIVQGRDVPREEHVAPGRPDWSFDLEAPGLRFEENEEPLLLEVDESAAVMPWKRVARLAEQGPADRVYELDADTGRVTFGNGVNGRMPAKAERALVTYSVCEAAQGNVARNRKWRVAGFPGAFGVNLDAIAGGEAARGLGEQRREGRRRAREEHALVSSQDIESAARALPLLQVARAWVRLPAPGEPRTGAITLVAMRARPAGASAGGAAESRRWLEAIRRRLAPHIPLGSRLVVTAPRYARFTLRARIEAQRGRDPDAVRDCVVRTLEERLRLVSPDPRAEVRQPGMPVTRRDVAAWIRAVEGVSRVIELQLRQPGRAGAPEAIVLPRGGLPLFDRERSPIEVLRPDARPQP